MKKWWQCIDSVRLVSLLCIWLSAWLFMLPCEAEINTPYFDNIWGNFLMIFGVARKKSLLVYQKPDLLCTIISFIFVFILLLRNIVCSFVKTKNKWLQIIFSLLTILVHSFLVSVIVKVLVFPQVSKEATPFLELLKSDILLVILCSAVFCIMAFGPKSLSAIALGILFFASVLKNIKDVSALMGDSGVFAIMFTAVAFFLEFCASGFDRNLFSSDFNYLYGIKGKDDYVVKNDEIYIPACEIALYADGRKSVESLKRKRNKVESFFKIKRKVSAIILITVSAILFVLPPVLVTRQMILMKGGWNGIKWNSTERDVKEFVKKNNTNASYRNCPFSHSGIKCHMLSWSGSNEERLETVEFQFKNSKLFSVVENGIVNEVGKENQKSFDFSDVEIDEDAKFIKEFTVESESYKKGGKKQTTENNVKMYEEKGFFNASVRRTFILYRKILCEGEDAVFISWRIVRQSFKNDGNDGKDFPLPDFNEYEFY